MKKIAIPVEKNGVLSAHFGHCEAFYIYSSDGIRILSEDSIPSPPHQPGLLPAWLQEQGVTDVIAGGMGQRAISLFNQNKINVYVGAPVEPARELVDGFLSGTLKTYENLCDH